VVFVRFVVPFFSDWLPLRRAVSLSEYRVFNVWNDLNVWNDWNPCNASLRYRRRGRSIIILIVTVVAVLDVYLVKNHA
jgi:hypothetical protein